MQKSLTPKDSQSTTYLLTCPNPFMEVPALIFETHACPLLQPLADVPQPFGQGSVNIRPLPQLVDPQTSRLSLFQSVHFQFSGSCIPTGREWGWIGKGVEGIEKGRPLPICWT